ncbi:MAG TPA: PaaI family thioesterase [Spongiibacteraceae bacterium]|jgi:uncharacterized protein (TIGR00369 family)|nr:PaaI family thioesterase [Spongiibacteraceae bacterium]HUH37049.1 PaaI family thioesterase [Spongiibacteraceae bacterium]
MNIHAVVQNARASGNYQSVIEQIPYAKLIGIDYITLGEELVYRLPAREDNLGNPTLPAIHGGVIGGFMEMAAMLHVLFTRETSSVPKVVDFSIDYLRPGRHRDSFARCTVVRQGKRIVNVSVRTWQEHQDAPIAMARAHFLTR